jgi:hypothetical protein
MTLLQWIIKMAREFQSDPPAKPMQESEFEFHLEEYKQIRSEVASLLSRVELLLRYSLVAAASVYAWLISQSVGLSDKGPCLRLPSSLLSYGWWIPPAFILLAGLTAIVTYIRIRQMGGYLRNIEDAIGISKLGWEKYLKTKKPLVTPATAIVWALLLATAIVATTRGIDITESASKNAPCKSEIKKSDPT